MAKTETLINGVVYKNVGTHETHCCNRHGCKYGNEKCPVADSVIEQEGGCPSCEPTNAIQKEIAELQEELAWSQKLEARGVKIYPGYW
jgi:hypothetical protein